MSRIENLTPAARIAVPIGAILWILGLEYFVAEAIAAAAWPDYSYVRNDISFLGALECAPPSPPGQGISPCSPLHDLFNAGMFALGALHLAGVALTWRIWPATRLMRAGLATLALGSVGAMLVAIATVDYGRIVHLIGAVFGLLGGSAGVALVGLALVRGATARGARAAGLVSLAVGLIGIAACALYAERIYLGLGRGTMERIAAYPQTFWFAAAGVVILWMMWRRGFLGARPHR